ncbi:C39 family peptidase [Leuconostoc sp. MS02]|uniref:C39 family peptidase n=1 Tax=Leuconostoc aquikimchii TaxID=3236804 RepID=A0ABV3S4A4_9LACO
MRNETQQYDFLKLGKVVCITTVTALAMASFLTNPQKVTADTIKGQQETQMSSASSDSASQVSAIQSEKSEPVAGTSTTSEHVQSSNLTEGTVANSSSSSSATEKSIAIDKQIATNQDTSKTTSQSNENSDQTTSKSDQLVNKPVATASSEQPKTDKTTTSMTAKPKNGFVTENGKTKYYQNDVQVTGEKKIDNSWYNFDNQGNQSNGLTKLAKKTVYYDNTGKMHYGYLNSGNTYMFFDLFDGHAYTGLRKYDQGLEYYGQDFKQVRNNYTRTNAKTIYFFGANGDAVKGTRYYGNGKLEYYGNDYNQLRNSYAKTGNTYYYLGTNGDAVKGFRKYSQLGLEYYGNDYKQYRNRNFNDNKMNAYHVNKDGDVDRVTLKHTWYSQLNQGYPEGCEATALQIALSNKNKHYSLPQIYHATGYGYDKTPATGFYGNPSGWGSSLTETVFASKLASSMRRFDTGISDMTGATTNDVISEVLSGNPVVTWGDYYWQLGRSFHVMTIVGYDNGKFLISDPYAYSQREYFVSTSTWHYVNSNDYALGWHTPSAMNVVVRA